MTQFIFSFLVAISLIEQNALAQIDRPKPWLGIRIDQAKKGVKILSALPKTPAARAGLLKNDIITMINKHPTKTPKDLIDHIASLSVNQKVKVSFLRNNKPLTIDLLLEAKVPSRHLLARMKNEQAAEVQLNYLNRPNSSPINLKDWKDKNVLLMFWATWCPACNNSFPYINDFSKTLDSNKNLVVAISREPAPLIKNHHTYPVHLILAQDKDGVTADRYSIQSLPSFVLIDKNGKVIETSIGGGPNLKNMVDVMKKLK